MFVMNLHVFFCSNVMPSIFSFGKAPSHMPDIDHSQEVEDPERYKGEVYEDNDEHRSIILALLGQLKLGMDLT